MTNLLETAGAQPQKQPKYVPLFMDKQFTGLYTQRSVLHDPSDVATSRFYGGRPDALWAGSNVELTNLLTLARRPGLSPFSGAIYPTTPDRAFSFQTALGQIQVIIDTGDSPTFVLTAVSAVSAGVSGTYTGTITGGAAGPAQFPNGAYAGLIFLITGFDLPQNNGTFVCISSTGTQLVLANINAALDTHAGTALTAGGVWYDTQSPSASVPPQLIFAKSVGAGQTAFVAVNGVLYFGDGVDTNVYTPNGPNGIIWDWGIAAPLNQPNVLITESGASAVVWQASSVYSTMGLVLDSNGNIQQLYTVNADTSNPTSRYGLSSNGQPVWNQSTAGTTSDGSVTWTNEGPITEWQGSTIYQPGQPIYDPGTMCIFIMSQSSQRTSGSVRPNFNAVFAPGQGGPFVGDGDDTKWQNIGKVGATPSMVQPWKATTVEAVYNLPASGTRPKYPNSAIIEPTLVLPPPAGQLVYLQVATTSGTTGSGANAPTWGTAPGFQTYDGQLGWTMLSNATWHSSTPYTQWSTGLAIFSVIVDSNGNFQVCTTTGLSGQHQPGTAGVGPWNTLYGGVTNDGSVIWTCVGQSMTWNTNTIWYLPINGFAPPSKSQPYGSSAVIDSNGNIEFVLESGLSNTVAPSWGTQGTQTIDNAITWYNDGVALTNSLSWKLGYVYAYSYESRLTTDPSNTVAPPGFPTPLGVPVGSELGDISTASPVYTITGANTGAVNTISGIGSLNPAVDTIIIWRSADGGGPNNMFFLTEIPNPPPLSKTVPGNWSFNDYLPDVATAIYPGLDNLIPAPIDDENNQPPSTFLPMVYNFERIWGADGAKVIWSGGPDVITGNPNAAFNPIDEFPYLATVTRVVKTSQGLVVMLTDSIEIIAGGPLTSSFYPLTLAPGIGMLSYNALDVYMGEIYFFSSDGQVKSVSPSLNAPNFGFALGDKFAVMNPNDVYVAVQQSGIDNCIMIADGSTGWYRCNPHQIPGGANGPEPIWSPFANITNGCQMVQSVEVRAGIKKLLVGATTGGEQILQRDLSIFTDGGSSLSPSPINLLTAATYGVLAGTTITNSGPTTITGDLGLSPGSAVTGAPTVTGATNIDNPAAVQAKTDLTTAYTQAAAYPGATIIPTELGGTSLGPGVYTSASGTFSITTGTLTLNAGGDPNAFWIFQMATTLVTGTGTSVVLTDSAQSLNVFWQVGSSATIGVSSTFVGTILALTSISVNTSATVTGRLLARNGAVTMLSNGVTVSTSTVVGTMYDANFTMGSIVLAHPGQIAALKFLEMDMSGVSYRPVVSCLLNEIAGTFTPMALIPQFDPPSIYGATLSPTSYSPNRYYFASTGKLARCRHLQINVDFGMTPNQDMIYNLCIFGRLFVEF
jgi:hypothetical protein